MKNILNANLYDACETGAVALLIDGENTSARQIEKILTEAGKLGEVKKRYVYGDWSEPSPARWKKQVNAYALELRQCSKVASHKNCLDIQLVVDAMDLFFNHHIRRFCIAASDSDYTPLVRYLCREGCELLGIGRPQTPQSLQEACSRFVFINVSPLSAPVTALVSILPVTANMEKDQVDEPKLTHLLKNAYYDAVKLRGGSEWVSIQYLGSALVKLAPNFKALYGLSGQRPVAKLVESRKDLFERRKVDEHLEVRLRKEPGERALLGESA